MERLATSMLAGEAPLAYLVSASCLAKIYATFVDGTSAPNTATQTQLGVSDRSRLQSDLRTCFLGSASRTAAEAAAVTPSDLTDLSSQGTT
jgi:hypothetical protein